MTRLKMTNQKPKTTPAPLYNLRSFRVSNHQNAHIPAASYPEHNNDNRPESRLSDREHLAAGAVTPRPVKGPQVLSGIAFVQPARRYAGDVETSTSVLVSSPLLNGVAVGTVASATICCGGIRVVRFSRWRGQLHNPHVAVSKTYWLCAE